LAVKPGDILTTQRTKYRVDALIGRGGMGHVFAATDLDGSASPVGQVAIKVVSRMLFEETSMARLHREAEAATRIRSEYVPRVLEVSDTADREMFLVMERLVGVPLSQHMREKGPLPWSEVVQLGEDVLRGLIDAHIAGVVHRDLKPSNVFLATKGGRMRAMVLDFGVCKLDTVDTERLTATGEAIGTVAYMAPEQIRGASRVDDRADLYAFGVLVFEMLSGRLPHDGPSQMAILASKLENVPIRLRECARVPTPDGLDEIVAKALQRDATQRFASAQELLKAWRRLGAAEGPLVTAGSGTASLSDEEIAQQRVAAGDRTGSEGASPRVSAAPAPAPPTQAAAASATLNDAHATQNALTHAGGPLRSGGSGRVAVALAGCALVAGAISVAAFFARGPDPVGGTRSVSAVADGGVGGMGAAAAPAAAGDGSEEAGEAFELDGDPAAEVAPTSVNGSRVAGATGASGAPVTGGAMPRKSSPRSRSRPASVAPKPGTTSGPHITAQPRY
jgi:serine/threonine-protein kinase